MSWFGFPKGINEIRNKIFFHGTFFDNFFFVFYDNFVIGDFDNLGARDGEFGV